MKEELTKKSLKVALIVTVGAVVLLALIFIFVNEIEVRLVAFVIAAAVIIVAWSRVLSGGGFEDFETFCKIHPEFSSERLQQTWENGEGTKRSRMDDEYIITMLEGQTDVIALKDVVWMECVRDGTGRESNGGWHIRAYDNKGNQQRLHAHARCLFSITTYMVKNHILILPEREERLKRIWENPNEFQVYIRHSRGRGGQNAFVKKRMFLQIRIESFTMRTSKGIYENDPVQVNSIEEICAEIQRLHAEVHPFLTLIASRPVQGVHSIRVTRIVRGGTLGGSMEFFILEAQVDAEQPEMGTELYKTSIATREEVQEIMADFVEGRCAPDIAEWVYVPEG